MDKYDEIWDQLDTFVRQIALGRRTIEVGGGDVAEFDARLNELCEKWHDRFKDMDGIDLIRFMLDDLFGDKESEAINE